MGWVSMCISTGVLAFLFSFQAQAAEDYSKAALSRINALRADARAPALSVSDALARAAAAHADDMARRGFFDHKSSNGAKMSDRVRKQRYRYCFAAENIAMGQGSVDEVLRAWMKSRPHRKNLLSRKADEFGLAWSEGNRWVMVLGKDGC